MNNKKLTTHNARRQSGQSVIEVVVALGIFIIAASASFQIFFGGQKLSVDSANTNLAVDYARQGVEALRNIRARNFSEFTDGSHGLVLKNNQWMFASVTTSDSSDIFTRTVQVKTVDPNTKIATTTVTWSTTPGQTQTTEIVETLTNWESFSQSSCKTDTSTGNWAAPAVVGSANLGSGVTGTSVAVHWPYVYVGSVSGTSSKPDLYIYDATNPASPTLIKSIDIGAGGITALWTKGNYVYAATSVDTKELAIFDVTTPASATLVGSLDLSGTTDAESIIVFNNTAMVGRLAAATNAQFAFINVTNPVAPTLIRADSSDAGDVYDSAVYGNNLYISSKQSDEDIYIYDISNPLNPIYIGFHDIAGTTEDISLYFYYKGGDINLLDGNIENEFITIGATTVPTMYVRNRQDLGGFVNAMTCATNDLAFVATSNSTKEFQIMNMSNPDLPVAYASINLPANAVAIDYATSTVYLIMGQADALRIIKPQ